MWTVEVPPPSLLLFLLQSSLAFKYESTHPYELIAPQTLCSSGVSVGILGPCPKTAKEVDAYDAIVMDEHGYVDVKISGVRFTNNEGRSLLIDGGDNDSDGGNVPEDVDAAEDRGVQAMDEAATLDKKPNVDNEVISESTKDPPIDKETSEKAKESTPSGAATKLDWPTTYHIQLYLVLLDKVDHPSASSKEQHHIAQVDAESGSILYTDFLTGNGMCCYEYALDNSGGVERNNLLKQCNPMDVRPAVPRNGHNQKASAPVALSTKSGAEDVVVSARFRPVTRGRHMVVISNCAAERDDDGNRVKPLTAHFNKAELKFVSKFGELPLSMMGIVPFYGFLLTLYAVLGLMWFRRSRGIVGCPRRGLRYKKDDGINSQSLAPMNAARPLLGLQRAIYSLVLLQLAFTFVAFAYYLHLNVTVVDIDVLYGGTMSALASFTPFSVLVALVHFVTFLSCQAVVMLATDGMWLIQNTIRPGTKKALCALGTAWACFLVSNRLLSRSARIAIMSSLGVIWVGFLLLNVRRSLRHLRSLVLGRSNETVVVVGGVLVAKRSMYRKMCAVVAIYPLIFVAGVVWNAQCQEDSWAWVGYVLVDVYAFIILFQASVAWLPRPLSAMEVVKYEPLDRAKTPSMIDDDAWEEEINYDFEME
eukprot:g12542.t1 g12542   contig6:2121938-2123950(-)